ncbi:MAG: hypothetical protein FWC71_01440 [Defluviitaleaceae bacterium]|nr:hypothetical protein [Defluviitaleaceae bacterium]
MIELFFIRKLNKFIWIILIIIVLTSCNRSDEAQERYLQNTIDSISLLPIVFLPAAEYITIDYYGLQPTHSPYACTSEILYNNSMTITENKHCNSIFATINNPTDYWIFWDRWNAFSHPNTMRNNFHGLYNILEYFDGYNWYLLSPRYNIIYFSIGTIPIHPMESCVFWFDIECIFGILPPGLYRIRMQIGLGTYINSLTEQLKFHHLLLDFTIPFEN